MNFFVFLSGIVIFFTAARGVIWRGVFFLLVFAVNLNVSMKRHMLIVSLFFARCCFNFISLLQHVLFQSFWFSCFPTRNSTFHESRCFFKRKSAVFTAARGVIWRAVFFLKLVFAMFFYVSMKRDMLIVTLFFSWLFQRQHPAATCCNIFFFKVSTYHEHDVNMPHPTPPINVPWTWR